MREQEGERLRRALTRLIDAQQEALETSSRALEPTGEDLGDDTQLEVSERLEAALEDVRAILEAASEDVQGILEGRDW